MIQLSLAWEPSCFYMSGTRCIFSQEKKVHGDVKLYLLYLYARAVKNYLTLSTKIHIRKGPLQLFMRTELPNAFSMKAITVSEYFFLSFFSSKSRDLAHIYLVFCFVELQNSVTFLQLMRRCLSSICVR